MRIRLPIALALAAVTLAACGDDEPGRPIQVAETATTSTTTGAGLSPAQVAADRVVASAAIRLKAAGRAKGCRGAQAVLHPTYGAIGDESCKAIKELLNPMTGVRSKAYGTAGVVDFVGKGKQRRSAVLVRHGQGLRLAFVEDLPGPTVDTFFAKGFDDAVASVLTVMETGDCVALAVVAHRSIGPALDEDRICDALPESALVKALEDEPELEPERLGGSSYYAFYAISPKEGPRYTVILAQQDPAAPPPAAASGTPVEIGGPAPRYAFVDALPVSPEPKDG